MKWVTLLEARRPATLSFFFFNDTATTEIYTLSLHDALPISIAEDLAINGFALQSRFGGLHNRAHLLDGIRIGFGDGLGDSRIHLGLTGAGRKVRLDDGELFGFFAGEFRAVALGELLDRFLALLYERLQNLNGLGLVECADLFDFFVLDGRLDSSEDAEAQFVFGAHGVDQVLLDFFGKTHLQLLAPLNIADREIRREGASSSGLSRTYLTARDW